ncbi:arsenosugar biosynthesis radical SAM protein ArsS [Ferrovum sp. PN-J185]|uniref:arsenosugar biosynthesis radical SAM (seleno)protein ArsS n=1 Tax=Ferrovum sp. PN-J185 TaxID=1356306 RepID=UPI000794B551|nr:arsenosugar biosynthesis radical SAM (seleno)protein ArsS [Ferrovum sp. PN-J185]KXW56954.1 cyclic pyranopterin monophosphate synthase [Ferrovum sp. PN-J185]MCC6069172.1 arsenosugar biosynthesis radical SAM protein ArsS [Ferrovum sp. PN-J185]
MLETLPYLQNTDFPSIKRSQLTTLQVNLGYKCNQSCVHCHVNAGPNRKEMMTEETLSYLIEHLSNPLVETLDLTGGAPELHPKFRELVKTARKNNKKVIDRCNLTILFEDDQSDLAAFLADQKVEIVASMPCYSLKNVNQQRGEGVFEKSIAAIKLLNQLGYGSDNSELKLHLVYNPQGPVLPPPQKKLESDYKRVLMDEFGIYFNSLYTITNMPIQRFGSTLLSKKLFNQYLTLLKDNFNSINLDHLMCKSLISIDWQGYVYDCDFNQQLNIPCKSSNEKMHIKNINLFNLNNQNISVAEHCYGCTAGSGSSCGGSFEENISI